jgi:hypothetical protein
MNLNWVVLVVVRLHGLSKRFARKIAEVKPVLNDTHAHGAVYMDVDHSQLQRSWKSSVIEHARKWIWNRFQCFSFLFGPLNRGASICICLITFLCSLLLLADKPNAEGIFAHSRRWKIQTIRKAALVYFVKAERTRRSGVSRYPRIGSGFW